MFANLNINSSLWVGPFVCPSVTKNLISLLATGSENRRHISSMHIYMYACMHVSMYACLHACTYACLHVCLYATKEGAKGPKKGPQGTPGVIRMGL